MPTLDELKRLRLGSPVVVDHKSGVWAGLSQDGATAFVRFPKRARGRVVYETWSCAPASVEIVKAGRYERG